MKKQRIRRFTAMLLAAVLALSAAVQISLADTGDAVAKASSSQIEAESGSHASPADVAASAEESATTEASTSDEAASSADPGTEGTPLIMDIPTTEDSVDQAASSPDVALQETNNSSGIEAVIHWQQYTPDHILSSYTGEHPETTVSLYRKKRSSVVGLALSALGIGDNLEKVAETTVPGGTESEQKVTFPDQPATDENGNVYTYTAKMTDSDGNAVAPDGFTTSSDGLEITNTARQTFFRVQKKIAPHLSTKYKDYPFTFRFTTLGTSTASSGTGARRMAKKSQSIRYITGDKDALERYSYEDLEKLYGDNVSSGSAGTVIRRAAAKIRGVDFASMTLNNGVGEFQLKPGEEAIFCISGISEYNIAEVNPGEFTPVYTMTTENSDGTVTPEKSGNLDVIQENSGGSAKRMRAARKVSTATNFQSNPGSYTLAEFTNTSTVNKVKYTIIQIFKDYDSAFRNRRCIVELKDSENNESYKLVNDLTGETLSNTLSSEAGDTSLNPSKTYHIEVTQLPTGYGEPQISTDKPDIQSSDTDGDNYDDIITAHYTITLTYPLLTGSLTISKKVLNPDNLKIPKSYSFAVSVDGSGNKTYTCIRTGSSVENQYETVKFEDGQASVTLKKDETLAIRGLPAYVAYTVSEALDDNGSSLIRMATESELSGTSENKYTVSGTIPYNETANVIYTNTPGIKSSVTDTIPIKKVLKNRKLKDKEFEFTLTEHKDNLPDTVVASAKNDADGNITFDKILFKDLDVHEYTVAEVKGMDENVTYDTSSYDVKAVVTYDEDTGKYKVTWTPKNTSKNEIQFTNVYKEPTEPEATAKETTAVETTAAETTASHSHSSGGHSGGSSSDHSSPRKPAVIDPPVMKLVNGDTPEKAATFAFVLKADDPSWPMPEGSENGSKTGTVTGAGSFEFGNIYYYHPGTYTYHCYEIDKGEEGYEYDPTAFTMKVEVTQTGNELHAVRTLERSDGSAADQIEFVNKYTLSANQNDVGYYNNQNRDVGGEPNVVRKPAVGTGDSAHIMLYSILIMVSAGILFVMWFVRRKKH